MNTKNMTHSALTRFAEAVDLIMHSADISPEQQRDLINYWAYQYMRPDMLVQLTAAITRCQADPDSPEFIVSATCRIDQVTGKETAFSPHVYR